MLVSFGGMHSKGVVSMKNGSVSFQISIIVIFTSIITLPFVYSGASGEYDSMRMLIGIVNSMKDGSPFVGYNYDISFAYYHLLELFRAYFEHSYENLFTVTNYLSAFFAILTQVPLYFIVKRYWGEVAAVLACLFFATIPVWWGLSLYGHPMVPAVLFFLMGLSLYTVGLFESNAFSIRRLGYIALSILLFSLALAFRLDVILLFPLLTAIYILNNEKFSSATIQSVVIGIISLIIFLKFQAHFGVEPLNANLNDSVQSNADGFDGIVDRLLYWHNLDRLQGNLIKGVIAFVYGSGLIYILLFTGCVVFLVSKKDYKSLFFLLPVVVINLFFWLPNPMPTRHFVYISPLIAVGCSLAVYYLAARLNTATLRVTVSMFLAAFLFSNILTEILFPIVRANYPWKYKQQDFSFRFPIRSVPINQINTEDYFCTSRSTAQCLLEDVQHKPNVILGDPIPIMLYMQLLSDKTILFSEEAKYGGVIFKMTHGHDRYYFPINFYNSLKGFNKGINAEYNSKEYGLAVDKNNPIISGVKYSFNEGMRIHNICK
jgi:hypothetical protein